MSYSENLGSKKGANDDFSNQFGISRPLETFMFLWMSDICLRLRRTTHATVCSQLYSISSCKTCYI